MPQRGRLAFAGVSSEKDRHPASSWQSMLYAPFRLPCLSSSPRLLASYGKMVISWKPEEAPFLVSPGGLFYTVSSRPTPNPSNRGACLPVLGRVWKGKTRTPDDRRRATTRRIFRNADCMAHHMHLAPFVKDRSLSQWGSLGIPTTTAFRPSYRPIFAIPASRVLPLGPEPKGGLLRTPFPSWDLLFSGIINLRLMILRNTRHLIGAGGGKGTTRQGTKLMPRKIIPQ